MIASGAPAWAVWLALGMWAVAIVVAVCVVLYARASWRRVRPQVAPYLSMLGLGGSTTEIERSPYTLGNSDVRVDGEA